MGRPDPHFNAPSSGRPGVMEMTEAVTKRAYDGVSSTVAHVSYGEPVSSSSFAQPCCVLKGLEYVYVGVILAAVLAIVLAVSLVFALRGEDHVKYVPRATPAPTPFPTPRPTRAPPRGAPSLSPTMTPTTAALAYLPSFTHESLRDPTSPQSEALAWISSSMGGIQHMETWRKRQLFALATAYFYFGGPNWAIPNEGQEWLNENQSECLWYSDDDFPTCNERGEYQSLRLNGLSPQSSSSSNQFTFLPPTFPPKELSFLLSLKSIHLNNMGLYGRIDNVLATEIGRLPFLQDLSMANNALYGSLPPTLGLFTELQRLQLQGNQFNFEIPSHIGSMTALRHLLLDNNNFSGDIPTQLGRLTHLEYLALHDNSLEGFLPSELGLLTALKVLDVSNNFLEPQVPPEILALPNLRVLNTTSNRLR